MDVAENKRVVLAFIECLSSDQPDWDVLDEDVRWWIQGKATLGKREIQDTSARIKGFFAAPARMVINHVTAEENRVAVEARSEIVAKDGRLYENSYHFLYLLQEGRIVEVREHFDTAYARDFFSAATQAAPSKINAA